MHEIKLEDELALYILEMLGVAVSKVYAINPKDNRASLYLNAKIKFEELLKETNSTLPQNPKEGTIEKIIKEEGTFLVITVKGENGFTLELYKKSASCLSLQKFKNIRKVEYIQNDTYSVFFIGICIDSTLYGINIYHYYDGYRIDIYEVSPENNLILSKKFKW